MCSRPIELARRMQSAFLFGALLALLCGAATTSAHNIHSIESVHEAAAAAQQGRGADVTDTRIVRRTPPPPPGKRAVFYSEHKLRSVVQATNYELRQLKRDFLEQITDIYLALKLDPAIGFRQALASQSELATVGVLLAAEFASVAIAKYTIERRLLTGIKAAFVRFMPMGTLVRLYKRYQSFAWLRYESQCDLRRLLPANEATNDEHVNILYSLIEARARVRAADDVLVQSEQSMQRILHVLQRVLVARWPGANYDTSPKANWAELDALAKIANRLLQFYLSKVVDWAANWRKKYSSLRKLARPLYEHFGGRKQLVRFVDELINIKVLDIDLSAEAQSLDLPPTISKQMVAQLALKWIPSYVLKSVEEDRKLVLEQRRLVMHLVQVPADEHEAELGEWASNVLAFLCRNWPARHY